MVPAREPPDVLTIGELVAGYVSAGKTGKPSRFWAALLTAHLHDKGRSEAVPFAREVARFKLGVEGHVGRKIDRESVQRSLECAGQRAA